MSFSRRLALFLVITLATVQGLTALFAYTYLRADLVRRGEQELAAAMGVFARQLDFLSERVADGVEVLSLDFALRSAIAQRDYGTELSALRNHGHRIGATRMMIVGLDGIITADTGDRSRTGAFPYPDLLKAAVTSDKGTALATIDGQIYWIVAVPVRAPVPIAFIAACIPVDDTLLDRLRTISSSPRAIALTTLAPNGHWMIAAESALHLHNIDLPSQNYVTPTSAVLTQNGREYLAVTAPLKTVGGSAPVAAMLDYPLDDALATYRGVIWPMISVMMLGLVAMLIGTGLIVRGVSRPLEMLARTAKRIAAGDYTPPARIARRDEVGQLGDALTGMTASIAQREQALRQAMREMESARDEAERANQAKSQFLSNMSHELRTPLNAIVGFSEMIAGQVLGPVGVPRYADYARDVLGAGQHLLAMIERMLDLAEAESNRLVLKPARIPVGLPMQVVVNDLQGFAKTSGVTLVHDDFASWSETNGDEGKLAQAFYNLIHNAIRFTPAQGHVTIAGHAEQGRFVIAISDTGCGMTPDVVETVVRPFERQRQAFDGKHQGAGLGLAFAKAVIELHGGALAITSVVGRGTTVTIALPAAGIAAKAA
ncbi:MAG TPA: ATP-binding protein [Bradyrhizobium sp.]